MSKIKILLTDIDTGGTFYYRSMLPARQLSTKYPQEFQVEVSSKIEWSNLEFLKGFDIIHASKHLGPLPEAHALMEELKKAGVIVIIDTDDYWVASKHHPQHEIIMARGYHKDLLAQIKNADYVTTTTPVLAKYIKDHNKQVSVFENAIDPAEPQYSNITKHQSDLTRIMWLGGSTHEEDLSLLKDSFHVMKDDKSLKGKYQLHLSGFNVEGTFTTSQVNRRLLEEMYQAGVGTKEVYDHLKAVNYDVDKVPSIPQHLKDKYRDTVLIEDVRQLRPDETVWNRIEKDIFTTNHTLITDKRYLEFLKSYRLNETYPNQFVEQPYIRHKSENINVFAKNYRHADFALAPVKLFGKIKNGKFDDSFSNRFQVSKSNLKVIEAAFHKTPVIASQVPAYTFDADWKDGKNILFVSPDRQGKDWLKKIKMLLQNPNMITDLGEAAYETALAKYNIETVTDKRAEFYRTIVKNRK
jgi:glycosyltransferase involved in cell wall biosynthesis